METCYVLLRCVFEKDTKSEDYGQYVMVDFSLFTKIVNHSNEKVCGNSKPAQRPSLHTLFHSSFKLTKLQKKSNVNT